MATKTLFLALMCIAATTTADSPEPVIVTRNKIFFEETLEGAVFENIDIFQSEEIVLFNEDNPYRLPNTTRPVRYSVLWSTDFDTLYFAGSVSIELQATQANVSEIVLHSSDLTISNVILTLYNPVITVLVPTSYTIEEEYHFLRVQLQNGALDYNAATPVSYSLTITYEAPMRSDMYGIYRSWFRTGNETRWMASTQFQATAARQAFPCYDEPGFKSYFDITIRRPASYRSWSCTRIAETTNSTAVLGYEEDRYHTTPLMSTYLLAIVVAEYSSIDLIVDDLLMYDVVARPDAINSGQGQYSFEVGQQLLAEMSNHTGIDFYSVDPNIKMTQASIPDFGAGAMENWGLLTYREAYLMYDEDHTTDNFKQIIAYILSHEIAHMWFGNLVTCDWWDVLWLNEGYYRVNYDDYTWNLIIIALRGSDRTLIHEYNRAQIVNDVFQYARSGLMTYSRAFNILSFLENETEYAPWVAAVTGFNWIRNRIAGSSTQAPLEAMIQRWATNVMNDLGYVPAANETFMRGYLRAQLAPVMCNTNTAACRAAASSQYAALTTAGTEVPKNNRLWVYCNALRDGTEADFNFLWNRFQTHNVYTEKIVILQSIGCTPYENSLNTFLDGIVQENELVRPQDYTTALNTAVTGNEVNTQIVFRYIQQNLANVSNAFSGVVTPLSYVSARLRTEQEITEFETWATNNQAALGNAYQSVYNGPENSRYNIEWTATYSADIAEYIITGDATIEASTPSVESVPVTATEAEPDLEEPTTPSIPDSAMTTTVSMVALMLASAANILA